MSAPGGPEALGRWPCLAVARFDQAADAAFEAHLRGHKAADLVMYAASALGEHSLVWLGLSWVESLRAGLGLRGLARAAAALSAESLLVNGLVKALFRRRRPDAQGRPPLPLRRPRTSSFPSGHASAAFFAAALLRRPGSPWALYYLLAALVSASRVHVRTHYASDVLAGAALGALLGELARRQAPFRLLEPPLEGCRPGSALVGRPEEDSGQEPGCSCHGGKF